MASAGACKAFLVLAASTWLASWLCLAVALQTGPRRSHVPEAEAFASAGWPAGKPGRLHPVSTQSSEGVSPEAAISVLTAKPGDGKQGLTVRLFGGLGNQLFEVSALVATALDNQRRFSVMLPDVSQVCCNRTTYWKSVLFNLVPFVHGVLKQEQEANASDAGDERCVVDQGLGGSQWDKDCHAATIFDPAWLSRLQKHKGCKVVTLRGFFQDRAFFARHLPLLRQLFWNEVFVARAKKELAALLPRSGNKEIVVSVHYRLGDYDPNGWVLERSYYERALLEVGNRFAGHLVCLVFSDDPSRAWARSEMLSGCAERVLVPHRVDDATSLYMMGLVDVNILADSSFSYWAALLGRRRKLVVAPQMGGSDGSCWSYLRDWPDPTLDDAPAWVTVAAGAPLSPQALLAEEVLDLR